MFEGLDIDRILQVVAAFNAVHLSAYHFTSDQIAMHNLVALTDRDTIVRQWFRAWDFGRKYGPKMVIGTSALFGYLAWSGGSKAPTFPFNLAAALSLGLVGPYTQLRVFPINDVMLAEHAKLQAREGKKVNHAHADKAGEKEAPLKDVKFWAAEWRRLDFHRLLLAHVAAISGGLALVKLLA